MFISCVSCIADSFFTAELSEKPSKREGRENTLSQNRSPSRGFANEGQTCARMSSRLRTLFFTFKKIVVKYITKLAIEPFLIIQFSGINHMHSVVQLSLSG